MKTLFSTSFALVRSRKPCEPGYRRAARAFGGIRTIGPNTPVSLQDCIRKLKVEAWGYLLFDPHYNLEGPTELLCEILQDAAEVVRHFPVRAERIGAILAYRQASRYSAICAWGEGERSHYITCRILINSDEKLTEQLLISMLDTADKAYQRGV